MSGAKHFLSINAAVMNCWARCSESDTPYVCLGDFLEKLTVMGWNTADTEAVRSAVLPMLGQLKPPVTVATAHATPAAS